MQAFVVNDDMAIEGAMMASGGMILTDFLMHSILKTFNIRQNMP